MSIDIKVIDSQGLEKTIRITDNENLRLAPGEHAYINPQAINTESFTINGDDLLISLTTMVLILVLNPKKQPS